MNLKTTIVLLILVVAGGFFYWMAPGAAPELGLAPKPIDSQGAGTLATLEKDLTPDQLTRIEVRHGDPPVVLQKTADGDWTLPGNWPTRKQEVAQLVGLVTKLRSRFAPEPIGDHPEKFGLEKPVTVAVKAGDRDYELQFGEKGEEGNRFSWPTYVRVGVKSGDQVDWKPEVVRLAPGLVAQLTQPADYYQQRRLFPGERVVKEGAGESTEKIERLTARDVAVQEKKDDGVRFELVRSGDGAQATWQLKEPVKDRVDPDKVNTLLTAVPEIWAEQFVRKPAKDLAEFGLKEPEQTLKVTRPGGETVTLLIGKVSQNKKKTVMQPPPPQLMGRVPPQAVEVDEPYRYAKLADNDQVFEIKADKLKDIFVKADELRDARLARFKAEDAQRVELSHGGETIILAKRDGRWRLEKPIEADAESSKITELLDKLANAQARDQDIIDKADPKEYGLDKPAATVKVTVEEEVKDGDEKKKQTKEYSFVLGKTDAEKKKLYVQVAGWDRVNAVEEGIEKLAERPALAYRGRRLLDFTASKVDQIEVQRGDEKAELKQADGKWTLTAPVKADADSPKVEKLADDLGRFETPEFVSDAPKPEDLDTVYGLAKPTLTATVTFTDKDKPPQTLLIGKERTGKTDYFAKLKDAPAVFVVTKEIRDALDQNALAFRPLDMWQLPPTDIARIKIQRQQEPEYTLQRDGDNWKLTAPFDAPVNPEPVEAMVNNLANFRADRYEAHTAKDLAAYGLDKPFLRVTLETAQKKPADAKQEEKKDEKKEPAPPKDRVLLIGKPVADKEAARFAKLTSGEAVFVVGPALVSAVDHGPLDLLDRKLLKVDPKLISKLQVENGKDSLTLSKGDKGWTVAAGPVQFTPDGAALDDVLVVWSDLQALHFADYGPKVDWAKYGLDKPAASVKVTATVADKPVDHTLALGKPVPDAGGDRYARVDNGMGVAVLPAGVAVDLTQSYLAYVDRTLLQLDPAAISGVQRKMKDNDLELTRGDNGWQIVKPQPFRADDQTLDRLAEQLARLRAVRVAAYPAKDLKAFGLDEPSAVLTLKLSDAKPAERIIKLGKALGMSGDRFVQVDGSDVIGVLPGSLVQRLLAPPLFFRDRLLARFADADKIVMERGGRKATFSKVAGTWKMTEPVAADAEQADLEDFVNAFARLRADELVADKPADLKDYGLDKPLVRWSFLLGDKEVLGLLVGNPEDGPRAYGKLANSDLVFLLDPKQTSRALAEYRNRTLWTGLDAAQADRIDFQYAKNPFTLEKVGNAWQIVGKPDDRISTEAVNDTLAALANLKAERTVEDKGADLKLFGLDPPQLTIEVKLPFGKRVLQIGNPEGESKRFYARVVDGNRSDVFVISEADAGKIVRDQKAFAAPTKPAS